ncbi:hypothetical protein GHT06_017401 [Daphnia sinensis]|uniref:Uncharacterized protein n=1 Tax=Daphnia sinensis TaxID=1820382 RepID=A0AAD5L8B6_9CRUS|nr:hypothetical protein GHT06_017401 [Daphnia sinensis]
MAASMKDRFFLSALWPLNNFLIATGVLLNQSNSQRKRRLSRFWSFFVLGLTIQSNIYIWITGIRSFNILFSDQQISIDQLIRDVLMIDAIRLSYLVFDAVIHISLVFSMWPSVNLYLETLESVDFNLGRPKLSHLKRYSFVGLAYMLLEVRLSSFLFYTHHNSPVSLFHSICDKVFLYSAFRLYRILSNSAITWPLLIQNHIRLISMHWFSVVPVWIYYICGQLHVFYVQKMVVRLNLLNELSRNTKTAQHRMHHCARSFTILRSLKQLYSAAELLHRRFSTMMMINSCYTLISMFSSSYYSIEFLRQEDRILLCRDSSYLIASFFRFWLMCHTADQIRETAVECIPILRDLRDQTDGKAEVMASTDRIKITSFIIEISQLDKNGDRQSVYGLLPLSKRLIIPTMEIIFTYLIIIYQFKAAAQ